MTKKKLDPVRRHASGGGHWVEPIFRQEAGSHLCVAAKSWSRCVNCDALFVEGQICSVTVPVSSDTAETGEAK